MADWHYGSRTVSDRINAYDDAEAIKEADPIKRDGLTYWLVRKVTRSGDQVIYDSRRDET
jgi:hypothetical protein